MSEELTPLNRTEAILSGEDLEPTNRLEYFLKEAASGGGGGGGGYVLTADAVTSADNGATLAIYADGTELTTYSAVHDYLADKYDKQIVFMQNIGGMYIYLYPLQFADISAAEMCIMSCLQIGDGATEIVIVGFMPPH